jgi:hypothetical protein
VTNKYHTRNQNYKTQTAREITMRLGGKWHGGYGTARCPVHDDHAPSLSIRDGTRALLVKCHAGCEGRDIFAELRRRGFIGGTITETDERRLEQMRRRRQKDDKAAKAAEEDRRRRRTAWALSIWRASRPAAGTLAEIYLRVRGITLSPPPSLRYHPELWHSESGLSFPALIGGVQGPDGKITAVHRTWLRSDGCGKAPVSNEKMAYGPCGGGAVRLAKAAPEMAIGEGIETCLSFLQETGIPIWATLGTSGMKSVILPDIVRDVIILVDLDRPGEDAAKEAAARFTNEGRRVRLLRPRTGKDINDAVNALREVAHV